MLSSALVVAELLLDLSFWAGVWCARVEPLTSRGCGNRSVKAHAKIQRNRRGAGMIARMM